MTEEEHEAKRRKAEARDIVTSWVLALWALGTAVYLTGGGAKHLVSPAYTYVMEVFAHDYHLVGTALLVAAVVNIVGVATHNPLTLAVGAIMCAAWLGIISLGMAAASVFIPDGGNLNWTTALGLSACFAIRAYNKIYPPNLPAVAGFLTLTMLPFL